MKLGGVSKEVNKNVISEVWEPIFQYTVALHYISDKENGKRQGKKQAHQVKQRINTLTYYVQQLAERCREILQQDNGDKKEIAILIDRALISFEQLTGLSSNLKVTWTFWNAMFLAVTTYTTIGYGNIVPKTTKGKVAVMFYSIVGIPLILTILHRLGRIFLYVLQRTWDFILWGFEICKCVKQPEKIKSKSRIVLDTTSGRESYNIPVTLAIGVTFAWMFTCAAIFLQFEPDWDYFKSFYFFFISLTTIGYGDVVPSKSTDMFIIFGLIIIGLSLVSMCINVIQIKLEHLFEDLMIMMMEEYQTAQLRGESMTGPPDIQGAFDVMQVWKMWKRRHGKKRRETPEPSTSESNLLLPLLAKKKKDMLISEWRRKAVMRVKGTQTNASFLREISTQTDAKLRYATPDLSPQSPPPHLGSRRMSPAKHATANYLPLLPECLESLSNESLPNANAILGATTQHDPYNVANRYTPIQCFNPMDSRQCIQAEVHAELTSDLNLEEELPEFVSSTIQQPHRLYRPRNTSITESVGTNASTATNSWLQNSSSGSSDSPPATGWVFVNGKAPSHGLPRGLVPAMYIQRTSRDVYRDDFKTIMHEIDNRLSDCRSIVSNGESPRPRHGAPPSATIRPGTSTPPVTAAENPQHKDMKSKLIRRDTWM